MKRVLALSAGLLLLSTAAHATVSVTQDNNAGSLAGTLLGTGITINSATVTGAPSAFGTFTNGSTVGGGFFDQGIILSSGSVLDAPGPNSSDNTTTNFGNPGDGDLSGLVGNNTFDAAILELEFNSTGGDLFFNYIFASEEYNEYTNSSVNDVFGFFLDGVNIALIPGTTDPVSINTVNGGNPLGTNASNPSLFNNNDLSDGGPFFDIEYDGFTNVFTASATGLAAGSHTLKIAIADTGDSSLDSAVFIQAGTLSDTNPTPVPLPGTLALFLGALASLGVAYRRFAK